VTLTVIPGAPKLIITELPALLRDIPPARRANTKVPCLVCGEAKIPLSQMVEHVGRHILQASRQSEAHTASSGETRGEAPCGFCGRNQCFTQLKKTTKKTLEIMSICPYRRSKMPPSLRYNDFDASKPCTNTPIHCPLCPKSSSGEPRTIWRYNAIAHAAAEHPGENLPPVFLVKIFISRREEEAMGVSKKETDDFRDFAGFPDSDGIEAMMTEQDSEMEGRGRSKTITGPSQRTT
jgi:hypothetical protein